eukprot:TRINITY_DN1828_c0_g1_i1.p1 TRINITY_DN1828_c0_g1~~TRINITY_DN1828_c0_g1_i1.p1  ORF type:complete len:308 (+),score=54.87 TRINITY_DN1828_c0_g1_i1:182-1105(+)
MNLNFNTIQQEWDDLNNEEQREPSHPNIGYRIALHTQNFYKNRYGNVLPNPETRVLLGTNDNLDEMNSEEREIHSYINANWIQGTGSTKYIACQAPLPNTFSDFWQMVFEQKVYIITMLTKFIENDRSKAHQYWPEKGKPVLFKDLWVSFIKEQQYNNDIVIREFSVKHTLFDDTRTIIQIHFTGWPDFGKPDCTLQFKELLTLVDTYQQKSNLSPILSHCSAGLGRTGTFIASHMAMESIRAGTIKSMVDLDLKMLVKTLRKQRRGMVQSFDQFLFIHEIVADMYECKQIEEEMSSPKTTSDKISS